MAWFKQTKPKRDSESIPKSHIFISYARADKVLAQRIVDALSTNDLQTWIDWKSIPKGEDWEQEIYRGIEEADAFLFLISPESIRSVMCNKELRHAVANRKRIVPIVLRDANPAELVDAAARVEIEKRNWVFCRPDSDDFAAAIEQTCETIRTNYDWLRFHRSLQGKALAWQRSKGDASRLLRGREFKEARIRVLEAGAHVQPAITDLQRQYLFASRWRMARERGIPTAILSIAIFSFVLWDRTWALVMRIPPSPPHVSQVNVQMVGADLLPDAIADSVRNVVERQPIADATSEPLNTLRVDFSAISADGVQVKLSLPSEPAYSLDFLPEMRRFEAETVALQEVTSLVEGALFYSLGDYERASEVLQPSHSFSGKTLLAQALLFNNDFPASRNAYQSVLEQAEALGQDTSGLQMGAALAWWRPALLQTRAGSLMRTKDSQECMQAHDHYLQAVSTVEVPPVYVQIVRIAAYYCTGSNWAGEIGSAGGLEDTSSFAVFGRALQGMDADDRYSEQVAKDLSLAGEEILHARFELSMYYSRRTSGEVNLCEEFESSRAWYREGVFTALDKMNARYLMRRSCAR